MPPYECPAEDPNGCQRASEGGYAITFYKGFMSRAQVSAPTGEKLLFDQGKNNPYVVAGNGSRPPASRFHVRLETPEGKDVLLKVDNSPLDDEFKGPIESITVVTGNPVTPAPDDPRVQVTAGRQHVVSLTVVPRGAGGGPRGQGPRGTDPTTETWLIMNNAQTCPKQCP